MTSLNHNFFLSEREIFLRNELDSSGKTGGGFFGVLPRRVAAAPRVSPHLRIFYLVVRFRNSPELCGGPRTLKIGPIYVLGNWTMITAIRLLRTTADACERQAKQVPAGAIKAELFDLAAEWHWLAGEAARLHDRAKELEAAA
jgi:hypothetical protein